MFAGGTKKSRDKIKKRNGVGVNAMGRHRRKRSDIPQLRSESDDDKRQEGPFHRK